MVLYDAINEKFKSVLLYGDEGKYLEERALLNQMTVFINPDVLDEPFLSLLTNPQAKLLSEADKNMINNGLWECVRQELTNILPDDVFRNFANTFESKIPSSSPNYRLSNLQNMLIAYFIEDLKAKRLDDIITEEEAEERLSKYQQRLIASNSSVLDDPSKNLGLDDSIKFYLIKQDEYRNAVPKKTVK